MLQFAVIGDVLLSKNLSPKIWMTCGREKGRGLKNKTWQKEVSALAARSVLIKNQQLLHCLGSWSRDSPCRNWWESHLSPPNCNCFSIYPTQRVLHGSQMAANVILLCKRGDFCIAAKAIVKMSYIKTKQKIKSSVFQTSENSTIAIKYQPLC